MKPALLLSGGKSRRLGFDKATVAVGKQTCINTVSDVLKDAGLFPIIEVGRGFSDLKFIREPNLGEGPLGAIVFGFEYFKEVGYSGPLAVVSCDLPYLNKGAVEKIVNSSVSQSVVAISQNRKQPLCAKWSQWDLEIAKSKFLQGERSLKWFPHGDAIFLEAKSEFRDCGGELNFSDIDTKDDYDRLLQVLRRNSFRHDKLDLSAIENSSLSHYGLNQTTAGQF